MKSKALAVQSIPEATEERAKRCQFSGHPLFLAAWIEAPVRPANWRRHVTSRTCLILVLFRTARRALGSKAAGLVVRLASPEGWPGYRSDRIQYEASRWRIRQCLR